MKKWTTQEHIVKTFASGDTLSFKSHTLKGEKEGPHIHIQASVHGAELQGNAAILVLMDELNKRIVQGSITIIPIANPYATNQKMGQYTHGRFNPVTGNNWNRNFINLVQKFKINLGDFVAANLKNDWNNIKVAYKKLLIESIEKYSTFNENETLNLLLQKISLKADAILDLHTGPIATRYLYIPDYAIEAGKSLLFDHNLVISTEFGGAMDEASFSPWAQLIEEFKKQGREIQLDVEAFTLEFGSEEVFDLEAGKSDADKIVNFLCYKGVLKDSIQKNKRQFFCSINSFKTIHAPTGGLFQAHIKPGEHFKKDDRIATIYNFKNLDPQSPFRTGHYEVKADEDGILINQFNSASIHQGMELFQIMTNTSS